MKRFERFTCERAAFGQNEASSMRVAVPSVNGIFGWLKGVYHCRKLAHDILLLCKTLKNDISSEKGCGVFVGRV